MNDFVTLLLKDCGHFGLVKEKYSHEIIHCSQCEVLKKDIVVVKISKRKFVTKSEVPVLGLNEMDEWMKKEINKRSETSERIEQ